MHLCFDHDKIVLEVIIIPRLSVLIQDSPEIRAQVLVRDASTERNNHFTAQFTLVTKIMLHNSQKYFYLLIPHSKNVKFDYIVIPFTL